MNHHQQKLRCKACQTLLAVIDQGGLTFKRNALQATFSGQFCASVVCYRCSELNVVHHSTAPPLPPKAA